MYKTLPENKIFRRKADYFVDYLEKFHYNDPDVRILSKKFKENFYYFKENGQYTGFIKGYGRLIGICSKNKDDKNINVNDMLFVFLHELAHCMCQSYDHDALFWKKFQKLENYANEINLIDFNSLSKEICDINVVRAKDLN